MFEIFSFSRADKAFEIFEVFEVFSLLCNYKMNRGFEIFEVFSFNRTDKAFEIFLSNGDSGYYNTIRRGPPAGGYQGPAIIPPKALRILVRICSQVPAKVQSALLHALGV